jgi:excisionase family DNA binding protein
MKTEEVLTSEVLTSNEAIKYLKTSKKTLFKMVEEGKIRANKLGRNYRFLKRELDRFLLQGEQED